MKLLAENDYVLDLFRGQNSLLDGKIKEIQIKEHFGSPQVCIHLVMRKSSAYHDVMLIFSKNCNFTFFNGQDQSFYNIERYKFFKIKDMYYISFDPYDEYSKIPSDQDNDIVISEYVVAYEITK